MINKDNWEETKKKYTDWWNKKAVKPVLFIVSPRQGMSYEGCKWNPWMLTRHLDNITYVMEEFEEICRRTYYGAEAFPDFRINLGPVCMAYYLGAEPEFSEDTVWVHAEKSLDELKNIKYDAANKWWLLTKKLIEIAMKEAKGRFFITPPEISGAHDVLSSLRGAQNLIFDMVDKPEEVLEITRRIDELWFRYSDEQYELTKGNLEGSSSWMNIWAPGKSAPLQSDFSAMISPKMFEKFVLPGLAEQAKRLDYTIYHMDGVGQIPHMEMLLSIPELDGIQWVPGAGKPPLESEEWFPIYKKIQDKGKLLVITGIAPSGIKKLMDNISPKGVFIQAWCSSQQEVEEVIKAVE